MVCRTKSVFLGPYLHITAPQGIKFNLAGVDWTINTDWANGKNELAMKKKLRRGDYKTLNIYFLYNIGGDFGVCSLPSLPSFRVLTNYSVLLFPC